MSEAGHFLSPVAGGRASQQIVEQITALLRSGKLAPGDRLPPERQLAEEFGVSRVTVRDALRVLEARGLMTVKVGASGGAFVTAPSEEVLGERIDELLTLSNITPEEVAEARLVMELGIVSLVVQRATDDDLSDLRRMCEVAATAVAERRYEPQMSNDFHGRLALAAHNSAVTKIAESFRGPLRMAALRAREASGDTYQRYQRTVDDHRELVEALKRRDLEAARAVTRRHLTRGTSLSLA